jgi:hypothetical protein
VAEEHGWATTYEAFAVSCPPRSTSASGRISQPCRRYGPCRRRMARKGKLINYINRLTSVSWHRDNGRDNNFLHVPMKCARGCCVGESRMLAQGAGCKRVMELGTSNATKKC